MFYKNMRECEESVNLRKKNSVHWISLRIGERWPSADFSAGTQQCVVQKASASWRLEFWQKKRHFFH